MDSTLILIVLISLIFTVALNLWLTLRLSSIIRQLPISSNAPFSLPVGEIVADFKAVALLDQAEYSLIAQTEQSLVLIFIDSRCGKCRGKLPELAQIQTAMQHAGVLLWIIATESQRRIKKFLKESGLLGHVVITDTATRKRLNPKTASPYYLFIDGQKILQAAGLIGDEDWLSFLKQMQEIKYEATGL